MKKIEIIEIPIFKLNKNSNKIEIKSTVSSMDHAKELKNINEILYNDRNFMLELAEEQGYFLKYAKTEFCCDKELVIKALTKKDFNNERGVYKFWDSICENLRNDKDVILKAVSSYSMRNIESYFPTELFFDKKFISKCVKVGPHCLEFVWSEFKSDETIVYNAVKSNGFTLEYADPNLLNNHKIIMAAISDSGFGYQYAPLKYKKDKTLALKIMKKNKSTSPYEYLDISLKKDFEIAKLAMSVNGFNMFYAPNEVKNNKELATIAIKSNPSAYEYLDKKLQKDKEIKKIYNLVNKYSD